MIAQKVKKIAFLSFVFLANASLAFAQAQFRITPPVIELEIGRGGTKIFSFELSNDNREKPVRFRLYAQDIDVDREGNTQFLETGKAERSCSSWIMLEQRDVVLEPGKSKKITGKISLPPSALSGGYYSAVLCELVSANAPQIESGALITWRIASLIKVSVLGGGIEKRGALEDFFLRTIFEKEQERNKGLTFVASLRNEGNIHLSAEGKLTILTKDKKRKGEVNFDVGTGTVLPGHIRDFTATYDRFLAEGDYIARATFRYGGTATIEKEIPFSVQVAATGEKKEGAVSLPSLKLIPGEINLRVPQGGFRIAAFSIQNQRTDALRIQLSPDNQAGAADWFTIEPSEVTIEGGREVKVILKINVPQAATEGAYKTSIALSPVLVMQQSQAEVPEPISLKINLEVPKR